MQICSTSTGKTLSFSNRTEFPNKHNILSICTIGHHMQRRDIGKIGQRIMNVEEKRKTIYTREDVWMLLERTFRGLL